VEGNVAEEIAKSIASLKQENNPESETGVAE